MLHIFKGSVNFKKNGFFKLLSMPHLYFFCLNSQQFRITLHTVTLCESIEPTTGSFTTALQTKERERSSHS